MNRGRPRKPRAVKEAQGTYRPDRDLSIEVAAGIPEPPSYMSAQALVHWDRMVQATQQARVLTVADGDALAMLCVAFEEWKTADIIVRDEGEVCGSAKGGKYQHPAVGIRSNAWKKIVRMLREFGLTPSARAGMKMAGHGEEENPIAQAFRQMSKHAATN
jgi:P27 family predicted phage terminase small subunit